MDPPKKKKKGLVVPDSTKKPLCLVNATVESNFLKSSIKLTFLKLGRQRHWYGTVQFIRNLIWPDCYLKGKGSVLKGD
jgi:hypothetical protein